MPRKPLAAFAALMVLGLAGPAWSSSVSLGLRIGYHVPASAKFREIYRGGPVFGGHLDVRLTKSFSLWAGAENFSRTGALTFTGEETRIWIMPVSAGLKARLTSTSLSPYLAAGAAYVLYKEESVIGTTEGGVLGGLAQAGLLIKVGRSVSLDLYARYSTARTKAVEPDILAAELGGFQGGLGLVIGF